MKVLGIGGEPGTGKTTLMMGVLKELGFPIGALKKKFGTLRFLLFPKKKLIVLGKYGEGMGTFAGTDKLSMGVQPDAVEFVKFWKKTNSDQAKWMIVFEGDRLFNSSFLKALEDIDGVESHWIILETSTEEKERRYAERGSNQNETWRKGRASKVANIQGSIKDITLLQNDNNKHKKANVRKVLGLITKK